MQTYRSVGAVHMLQPVLVLINALIVRKGYTDHADWYFLLLVTLPLMLFINYRNKKEQYKS
jgi:hypothetical protein